MHTAATIPTHVRKALQRLLAYVGPEELSDYEATPEDEREFHIQVDVMTLRKWLDACA